MSSRDQVTELVEAYVVDHNLSAGDKLPSERELCEMWGVNRMTLRNALRRLTESGLIRSEVGVGTFVAEPKVVRNLQDTIGFSEAIRNAGHEPSYRVVSCELREANKFCVRNLHVMLASPVLILCRVNKIDGVPASVETTWVNASECPGIELHDFAHESLYKVLADTYGIHPAHGHERIDVTRLDESEARLLGREAGTSAFYQSGLIEDDKHRPVEYFKNVVLPDHLRFATELRRNIGEGR